MAQAKKKATKPEPKKEPTYLVIDIRSFRRNVDNACDLLKKCSEKDLETAIQNVTKESIRSNGFSNGVVVLKIEKVVHDLTAYTVTSNYGPKLVGVPVEIKR